MSQVSTLILHSRWEMVEYGSSGMVLIKSELRVGRVRSLGKGKTAVGVVTRRIYTEFNNLARSSTLTA